MEQHQEHPQRWWRGLRARVTLAYAIGSLLLSSTVAGAAFALARSQLLSEAEHQQRQQSYFNATDVRQSVLSVPPNLSDDEARKRYTNALDQLATPTGSRPALLLDDGHFFSPALTKEKLPVEQMGAVTGRYPVAEMVTRVDGDVSYIVGIRLDSIRATYFEVRSLTELEGTLNSLRAILVGVALVAGAAGAGLGYYSARRALAPLSRISSAATAIASGDFSTRLDMQEDRDLARIGTAFNDMVDAVSLRIDRERQFTSDVSHELRSPLMTLTASVEVLERRRESLPDVAQQAIELLSHDLDRFARLVEDLLEISRMEAGAVQLQLSQFKLEEFLENVLTQSRCPHLLLGLAHEGPDVIITADKRRLAQVLVNLLDNAEKYGGGATNLSYQVIHDDNPGGSFPGGPVVPGSGPGGQMRETPTSWVQIVVEDEGPGVPAEARDRIFDRFARLGGQAGNRSAATGFGLGLSLVAEHVRLHGGSVWVTDRIDGQHGARFVVQLPLGSDHELLEEMAS